MPQKYCSHLCRNRSAVPKNPDKKTTTSCPACGKVFEYWKSWPRKYCSDACKGRGGISNIHHYEPSTYQALCEQCGKPFETTPKRTRGRFCSQRCMGDWNSAHLSGEDSPHWGKKRGRSPHLPPPSKINCLVCGAEVIVPLGQVSTRKFCSMACAGRHFSASGNFAGPNSPVWKGGRLPYYGPSWMAARKATRARDQVCQGCGISPAELGKALDVHHLKPFREFGVERHEEANDLANLVALCPACHKVWETKGPHATTPATCAEERARSAPRFRD